MAVLEISAAVSYSPMVSTRDRMAVILHRKDHERWMPHEPDPSDLMNPFDTWAMTMWPISRRLSTFRNAGPEVINRVDLSARCG
ncbi:hypothetical protein CO659_22055 [Rhizobium sp. S9]|nr:hypothetical protein CO659_22055 [Rhizobium sp. S9]